VGSIVQALALHFIELDDLLHRTGGESFFDNANLTYSGALPAPVLADLNARVGSLDIDWLESPSRVEADPAALPAAYRSGVVNEGTHLDRIAILDQPGYFPGDRYEIHDSAKSWDLRARLDAANGGHGNNVLWYGLQEKFGDVFGAMDSWLAAVEKDKRSVPVERKVVEDRPQSVHDSCEFPNRSVCDQALGPAANPRWGAGNTIANDVMKCRLKPLARNDYAPILFSDAEWEALKQAFPTGVCDWTKPGVGQQPTVAWQTYADGPGGRPLGPPPRSAPLG